MKIRKFLNLFILGIAMLISVSSCKTSSELTVAEARPISTNKLLKRVEENAFDYDYFTIKRIYCNFSSTSSKANFKINLKAQKNKVILISISKLNIPVGRVLLTPDSVKYVNYINKNYFIDDYSYLSSVLNIDLDFKTIQSIISNNAFSYRNDPKNKDFRAFHSFIEDNMYVLQSEKTRKFYKLEGKENKAERRLKRFDDKALIFQRMYISPDNYTLHRLNIIDKTHSRDMDLIFSEFTKVNDTDFPENIRMNFISKQEKIGLKIKMSGFSTEKINSFNIKIPEKYKQIRVN